MKTTALLALVTLAGVGCASANRIERGAERHEARAQQLEPAGNTQDASIERNAAAKQYSKANTRRGFENAMPIVFR
jgi:hypothetical protein